MPGRPPRPASDFNFLRNIYAILSFVTEASNPVMGTLSSFSWNTGTSISCLVFLCHFNLLIKYLSRIRVTRCPLNVQNGTENSESVSSTKLKVLGYQLLICLAYLLLWFK
jgi:hypothetical protein